MSLESLHFIMNLLLSAALLWYWYKLTSNKGSTSHARIVNHKTKIHRTKIHKLRKSRRKHKKSFFTKKQLHKSDPFTDYAQSCWDEVEREYRRK